jgi:hypothetical protein
MGVQKIIKRIQACMEDPAGKLFTRDYILTFLDMNNEDLFVELAAMGFNYDDRVVVLEGVPANTNDLILYQQADQPLAEMMTPISMEWKPAGAPDEQYRPVLNADKVLDVKDAQDIRSYEWREGRIRISPATIDVDLRMRVQALPEEMNDESDPEIVGLTNVLVYRTASMIWGTRGNDVQEAKWGARALEAKDNFQSMLIKREQGVVRKFGKSQQRASTMRFRTPVL